MLSQVAIAVLAALGTCSAAPQWGWYPGGGSSAAAAAAAAAGGGSAAASAAASAASGGGYFGGGYYPYAGYNNYYNPSFDFWGSPFYGFYCDNTDPSQIKTEKDACLAFIELNQADHPLRASEISSFITNQIIENNSTEARKKRERLRDEANVTGSPDAATFQCCHVVFAKEFFPKSNEQYEVPTLPHQLTCQKIVGKLFAEMSGKFKNQIRLYNKNNTTRTQQQQHAGDTVANKLD